jgi:inosine-uridine nucleoside N-ribohydrolase
MAIGVETKGTLSLGQTVPMRGQKPNMRVCVNIDGARIAEKIFKTILASPGRAPAKPEEYTQD